MGRRSDNPLSILVIGVLSIAFFGSVVVYFNETRPILKLRPALIAKFGAQKIKTRFIPAQGLVNSSITVIVPKELAERRRRLEIGLFALPEYRRLAEGKTRVTTCTVLVEDDARADPIVVSLGLIDSVRNVHADIKRLRAQLKGIGLSRAHVEVEGYSYTGAFVRARARAREPGTAGALAKQAVAALTRNQSIGRCEVTITDPKGKATLAGGRDEPR